MKHFLPLPLKRTDPCPDLGPKLKEYIADNFHDTHPDVFDADVSRLTSLRRDCYGVQGGQNGGDAPDVHPTAVDGLILYHAQVAFLLTKFPYNVGASITYHLPFPPSFSFQTDPTISLPSLSFERAAVVYNLAAVYSGLAAVENRDETEGIKRALTYLQQAAGTLNHLRTVLVPRLTSDLSSSSYDPQGSDQMAGYDMTPSFVHTMETFCLAQAQECFWQRAMGEKYTNGVIAKLAAKVSEYYRLALEAARASPDPAFNHLPQSWISHMTAKRLYFEAVSQYRMSQEDLAKQRYGEEIARMKQAEVALKQALTEVKRTSGDAVLQDIKGLQDALASNLKRAIRDNDIIYVSPIPPPGQLAAIVPAGMVKSIVPPAIEDSIGWLNKQKEGLLFAGLVPYGVHLALSIYDDRKDTLVRDELEQQQDRIDAMIATRLQSLGLPGSITALERPTGLPPSLLKKAEEVFVAGGLQKPQHLIQEIKQASASSSALLEQAMDLLDQEATEEEHMLQQHPEMLGMVETSTTANQHYVEQSEQFRTSLRQARRGDEEVRKKWDQWAPLINVLAGGEEALMKQIPTSGRATEADAELPAAARALQTILEDLDDARTHRARLVNEGKRVATKDDIRSQVLEQAAKMSHGSSSGEVKPEWFEDIFEKELRKYHRLIDEMRAHCEQQERVLGTLEERNNQFLAQRQDDSRIKYREKRLQEMELAYWKWREIISNCEEGLNYHTGLASRLVQFKDSVQNWVYARRSTMDNLLAQLSRPAEQPRSEPVPEEAPEPEPQARSPPAVRKEPVPPAPSRFTLPPPSAAGWESAEDFLPPPPPSRRTVAPPIPPEVPTTPSRRVTRSSMATPQGQGGVLDSAAKPPRKKGGMAI